MPKLVFDTCCRCIELRTGCLIIAYFDLIRQILIIGMGILGITMMLIKMNSGDEHALLKRGDGIFEGLVFSVLLLIFGFFFLAFTIVLLVGLHKHKRSHVMVYLIYDVIFHVISIILLFVRLANRLYLDSILLLLSGYFLLVIRSYYYKMDEKRPAVSSAA